MVNWLRRAQIIPKGHPLVWFHEIGTPLWLRDKSYPEVKKLVADRVLRITSHYGAKIPYYDIINEANGIPRERSISKSCSRYEASRGILPYVTNDRCAIKHFSAKHLGEILPYVLWDRYYCSK